VTAAELSELVARPPSGRVFFGERRPGLADCAPSGRVRLDALARWLQDVAWLDVDDAGLAGHAVWVLRRTRIAVSRFPRFGEPCTLATYCSGVGRMWAERRTTVTPAGAHDSCVEAVALWVHLDPSGTRPTPLTPAELATYEESAAGRRVSARLRHRSPDGRVEAGIPWTFRATDCDVARHVNNAAYWQALEEELLADWPEPARADAEIEFRNPSQPGEKLVLREGEMRWIVDGDGETHASILVAGLAPAAPE
jgi:acyl-ACP thioesterase